MHIDGVVSAEVGYGFTNAALINFFIYTNYFVYVKWVVCMVTNPHGIIIKIH